jgi:isopenicillin-N N-acyltransferase-like protein
MHTDKIPVHVAIRLCLESGSSHDAMEKLENLGGVASAQHILIADPAAAIGMEVSPLGPTYLSPDLENKIITHTNHFVKNRLVESPLWLTGSSIRLQRINEILGEMTREGIRQDQVTGELLRRRVFSDTFNSPQAICCSEDPARPVETRSSTLFNIIMHLEKRNPTAEVVWGMPGSLKDEEILHIPW